MVEQLYSSQQVEQLIEALAIKIIADFGDFSQVALVGIRTGGMHLASRLQEKFKAKATVTLPLGILDINLYRDDFDLGDRQPDVRESKIDFSVGGTTILLVDDVLFTGRTIRAALEALGDYGRPAAVRLAVLIDRGHRELPIEPDYTGVVLKTSYRERIKVRFADATRGDRVEKIQLPQVDPSV